MTDVKLTQFTVTRTAIGHYKLTLMSVEQTEAVYRGNALYILWQIARHFRLLRGVKPK